MNELTPAPESSNGTINVHQEFQQRMTITTNLDTAVVVTTRDKIDNVLHEKLPQYRRTFSWQGPVSVMLALGVALVTADFKNLFGVDPAVYFGMFLIATVGSVLWTIVELYRRRLRVNQAQIVDAIARTHDVKQNATLPGVVISD